MTTKTTSSGSRTSTSRSNSPRPDADRASTAEGIGGDGAARMGLDTQKSDRVSALLSQLLADQHVLYQKTRMCHWNLVGGRFDSLHKLFDTQYQALAESIDQTAERMRMLDQVSPAAMQELLEKARLEEVRGLLVTGQQALTMLLADHEATIRWLRADINACAEEFEDVGTADFLTGMLRAHEMTAWMLRSHLEG